MLPDPIKNFVDVFSKLPSIGPRQATRLAFYLSNLGKNKLKEISDVARGLADLTTCAQCFRTHVGRGKLCSICSDPTRNQKLIAIVEKETDLISLEKTKKFNGRYLVIGELQKTGDLEPEQKLRLSALKNTIKKGLGGQPASAKASADAKALADKSADKADEIILAVNPTIYGDLGASILKKEGEGGAKKIPRLGRCIPTGGEIEFADEETLGSAIDKRS